MIASQISKKIKKHSENLKTLEKKIQNKYTGLSIQWSELTTSMSQSISERYLSSLSSDIEIRQRLDPKTRYYLNVATMLAYDKAL